MRGGPPPALRLPPLGGPGTPRFWTGLLVRRRDTAGTAWGHDKRGTRRHGVARDKAKDPQAESRIHLDPFPRRPLSATTIQFSGLNGAHRARRKPSATA